MQNNSMINSKIINILIVEDSKINQEICINLLKRKGWNSYTAINGYKALEMLKKINFNIVLMDIIMSGMGGYETTAIIRNEENKTGLHTIIIALTATSNKDECIRAGMDDYISKPIDINNFYKTIEKFL